MSVKNIKNISLLLLLFLYALFYKLFLFNRVLQYAESISAGFIIIITFLSIYLFGFKKDKKNRLRKSIISTTVTNIILFFAISYGIGLMVGFLKNSYSLTFSSILDNVFAPIVIIICTELFRYVMIGSNKDNKLIMIFTTIVIIAFDLALNVRGINVNDVSGTFKTLTATILPIISKNIVLSYTTYYAGYLPGMIYRLVMDLYVFVMPIIPDFGDYINSMIGIALPFIIYIYSSRLVAEYNQVVEHDFSADSFRLSDIPFLVFIVLLVCLISGYFPLSITGIGSGSMSPKIKMGDAVIINKVNSEKELKVGQVIAFYGQGKTIVHRLVEIEKVDGKTYYRTKGDANNSRDKIDLTYKDIKGIVKCKIPFVAYPSIYLSDFLKAKTK